MTKLKNLDQFVVIPTASIRNHTDGVETICHLQQAHREATVDEEGNEIAEVEQKNITLNLSEMTQDIRDKAMTLFSAVVSEYVEQ